MSGAPRKQRFNALLGLSVDESRLQAVLVRRKNGSFLAPKTLEMPLEGDLRAANAESVGRELRLRLDKAGLRESRCAVSLPLAWMSTLTVPIPDVPESDVAGFLELEAERGFLFAQDTLAVRTSRIRTPVGERHATLVAVSLSHLQILDRMLQAARLKPVRFTPGLTALQSPEHEPSTGVLALAPRHRAVELQVTGGGGVLALRSLDVIGSGEGEPAGADLARLSREIRVTLGPLPAALRGMVTKAKVFGGDELSRRLARDLAGALQPLGISCASVPTIGETPLKGLLPDNTPCTPELVVAVHALRGMPSTLEFLPPRVRAWRQLTERIQARRLVWGAAAVLAVAVCAGGLFVRQQWQLSRLERQWDAMQPRVEALEGVQAQIKQFRPWYDASFRSLRMLRGLTEAFPETGVVTAKSIEIREPGEVTCTGQAGDRQAILDMLDRLSSADGVHQVKVDQILGKDPLQFSFNFQWETGGARDR